MESGRDGGAWIFDEQWVFFFFFFFFVDVLLWEMVILRVFVMGSGLTFFRLVVDAIVQGAWDKQQRCSNSSSIEDERIRLHLGENAKVLVVLGRMMESLTGKRGDDGEGDLDMFVGWLLICREMSRAEGILDGVVCVDSGLFELGAR